MQAAAILNAAQADLDIADGAIASMSGGTSQPNLNTLVESLRNTPREGSLQGESLDAISEYWREVREFYQQARPLLQHPLLSFDESARAAIAASFAAVIERERYLDDSSARLVSISLRSRSNEMHSLLTALTSEERARVGDALVRALDEIAGLLRQKLQEPR